MREILFRGKRIDNGEWVEGFLIGLYDPMIKENTIKHAFIKDGTIFDGEHKVDPETIGQYTGLTDRNGKKIFEGDILKGSDNIICVVEWDTENARFLGRVILNKERYIAYIGREPKSENIGNIYDNPELLN